jgi:hypothetical protein
MFWPVMAIIRRRPTLQRKCFIYVASYGLTPVFKILSRVCVDYIDGVLDWQLDLLDLDTITVTAYHNVHPLQQFSRTQHKAGNGSSACVPLQQSSGIPCHQFITALALFSGQPFPSDAFFLSCLSSRYQVTSTPQAYMSQYVKINLLKLIEFSIWLESFCISQWWLIWQNEANCTVHCLKCMIRF